MLRNLIVVKIISLLAMSICQADELYDQSVLAQVNQYITSNTCIEKCTFRIQSSGIEMDVDLTRLMIDLNSDGEPDYILSSRDNCGASSCIDALLASNNKKLINVFEGQGIAYFSQSTNNFRDLVQGKRGPGQPSYEGTGKIPIYRWNGERYIESGSIDDQTSSVTSIHTDLSSTPQNITSFSSEPDFIIKQGQNKAGFELTSTGESYYAGQLLFPRWLPGGQDIQLAVYKSINSERALVKLWGIDWGGLRLALVDLLNNKILNNKFIPDQSVRSLGNPDQIKQIGHGVSWSPDNRFAALQYIFAEHEADLAVINLKNGFFQIFPTKSSNKVFSVPDLEKLNWKSNDTFSVELFQVKCRNDLCEELVEETNNKTLSFSLSALVSKSTQHNQYGTDPIIVGSDINMSENIATPKTANSTPLYVIETSAGKMCQGLPVACQDVYKKVAKAWWKESLKQMQGNHTASRSFEMLFSNPDAILSDTERLQLFENMLNNKAFVGELRDKLNAEFLSREDIGFLKLDKAAMKNIAGNIAESLLTDIVIEYTALGLEKNGKTELAYWIRTSAKPNIDIIKLAQGLVVGSTTVTGATIGAGVVWAKNIFSFTTLGMHLNADDRAGKDIDSELARLANQNVSIIESLMSGETRGVLYEGYSVRRLTQKEIDALQDMLITNNNYQSELLKKQAMYAEFDWVVKSAKWFASVVAEANNSYSGLEHANSTPSFIDVDKQTGTQPNNIDPFGKTVIQAPKEPAKRDCNQRFNYSSAVTGLGAQSALSKYAFDQGECQ